MKNHVFLAMFCVLGLVGAYAHAGELINGDFETGLSPWVFGIKAPEAVASVQLVPTGGVIGSSCVYANITTTAGINWDVGVVQDEITVMSGKVYKAYIFLKADRARQVSLEVKRSPSIDGGAWEGIANADFNVTTDWAEYSMIVVPKKNYPDTAFIGVYMAQEIGEVWVDGVRLVTKTEVNVDIKPGSFPNHINLKSKGVISLAVLTTEEFDATAIDPLSVRFGAGKAAECHEKGHIKDVDGDGDLDMCLHFKIADAGIQAGDTEAKLRGEAVVNGERIPIGGTDSIKIVGGKPAPSMNPKRKLTNTWGSIKSGH